MDRCRFWFRDGARVLISGSILGLCRIRGDGKKFVSISDLSLKINESSLSSLKAALVPDGWVQYLPSPIPYIYSILHIIVSEYGTIATSANDAHGEAGLDPLPNRPVWESLLTKDGKLSTC